MPAKTVLFVAKCKPVFDLGTGPYNIIKWNPQASSLQAGVQQLATQLVQQAAATYLAFCSG